MRRSWVARAQVHGRGGVRQTLRFDGRVISVTDFFYGLRRIAGSDQPAYYLVTWRGGRWTSVFLKIERADEDLL